MAHLIWPNEGHGKYYATDYFQDESVLHVEKYLFWRNAENWIVFQFPDIPAAFEYKTPSRRDSHRTSREWKNDVLQSAVGSLEPDPRRPATLEGDGYDSRITGKWMGIFQSRCGSVFPQRILVSRGIFWNFLIYDHRNYTTRNLITFIPLNLLNQTQIKVFDDIFVQIFLNYSVTLIYWLEYYG